MRLRVTVTVSLLLAALALVCPTAAEAHRRSVARMLMLEASGDRGLEVLVHIRVPGGDARRTLDLLADQNRDGRYDTTESRALEAYLAGRALDGLLVRSGTTALALLDSETKLRVSPGDGSIEVMVHLTSSLPARPGPTLSVSTGLVGDPLDLIVLSGSRRLRDPSRGTVEGGRLEVRMELGDRVQFRLD